MPTPAELLAQNQALLAERDAERTAHESTKSELKSLNDKIEKTPDFGGVHGSREAGAEAWWEEAGRDEPNITVVRGYQGRGQAAQPGYRSMKSSMKALHRMGYNPIGQNNKEFKSINDFVRQGLEKGDEGSARFRENYKSQMKALGMSENIGADGGFAVIPEWNLKIHEHMYASNNMLARTDNYNVSGNSMTFLANAETSRVTGQRAGGLQGYWTGESASLTASKPTIREIQMKLMKLTVLVYLTDELLKDNSMALEQYIIRKATEEFNWLIADALFNGIGAGKPLGIQSAPSLLVVTTSSSANTISAIDIIKMQNRLFAPYMQDASWFVNQDTIQQLMQLTLATGTYSGQLVYQPPTGLAGLPYGTLGGRPVEPIEWAKSLTNQGDITLADLGQLLSITKGGVEQATSMHVAFLTDEMAIRLTMRVNASPWENSVITPANGSTTQSSFVTLAAR